MIRHRKIKLTAIALAALAVFARVHTNEPAAQPSALALPPAVTISKL